MSTSPSFFATPNVGIAQIANADASAYKDLFTAGASGSKVVAITAASDDASLAHVVQLSLVRSATVYPLGAVNVPISAGSVSGTPAVDLLQSNVIPGLPVDNDGQRYLFLMSGDKLQVKSLSTMTAAKLLSVVAIGADA